MENEFVPHTQIDGNTVYQIFAGRTLSEVEVNRAIRDQSLRRETRTERQGKRLITRISIFPNDEWLNAQERGD